DGVTTNNTISNIVWTGWVLNEQVLSKDTLTHTNQAADVVTDTHYSAQFDGFGRVMQTSEDILKNGPDLGAGQALDQHSTRVVATTFDTLGLVGTQVEQVTNLDDQPNLVTTTTSQSVYDTKGRALDTNQLVSVTGPYTKQTR